MSAMGCELNRSSALTEHVCQASKCCTASGKVTTIDPPGVSVLIGVWAIYHHPSSTRNMPVRYRDTDAQDSKGLALGRTPSVVCARPRLH
jgi:hypothetical protein